MLVKRIAIAAGLALIANAAVAQGFSDNSFSYRYQPFSREPGINTNIPKNIIALTHVDAGQNFIDNFMNVDLLQSNDDDPANNAGKPNSRGATEVYALWRGDFNNQKLFGQGVSVPGFIRDVTFQIGADANTKNTAFAPEKKDIVFGPNIHFDIPGFFNVAVHYYQEWNYNGIVGKSVNFNPTAEFELVYLYPLSFTGLPLRFQGFTNFVLPKG